jgi:hypothetical protein
MSVPGQYTYPHLVTQHHLGPPARWHASGCCRPNGHQMSTYQCFRCKRTHVSINMHFHSENTRKTYVYFSMARVYSFFARLSLPCRRRTSAVDSISPRFTPRSNSRASIVCQMGSSLSFCTDTSAARLHARKHPTISHRFKSINPVFSYMMARLASARRARCSSRDITVVPLFLSSTGHKNSRGKFVCGNSVSKRFREEKQMHTNLSFQHLGFGTSSP